MGLQFKLIKSSLYSLKLAKMRNGNLQIQKLKKF
jgi:hypothetical protein